MARLGILLFSLFTLAGCQTASPVSQLGNQDRIVSTALGAVIGGVVGGVIGHQSGHTAEGAAIGAALGGGVGYVVGDTVAKRRKKFADEAAFFNAEIEEVERALVIQRARNEKLRQDIEALDAQLAQLRDARDHGTDVRREREAMLASLDRTIDQNKRLDVKYREATAYLDEAMGGPPASDPDSDQRKVALQQRLDELRHEHAVLVEQTEKLQEQRRLASGL